MGKNHLIVLEEIVLTVHEYVNSIILKQCGYSLLLYYLFLVFLLLSHKTSFKLMENIKLFYYDNFREFSISSC